MKPTTLAAGDDDNPIAPIQFFRPYHVVQRGPMWFVESTYLNGRHYNQAAILRRNAAGDEAECVVMGFPLPTIAQRVADALNDVDDAITALADAAEERQHGQGK